MTKDRRANRTLKISALMHCCSGRRGGRGASGAGCREAGSRVERVPFRMCRVLTRQDGAEGTLTSCFLSSAGQVFPFTQLVCSFVGVWPLLHTWSSSASLAPPTSVSPSLFFLSPRSPHCCVSSCTPSASFQHYLPSRPLVFALISPLNT